MRDSYKEASGNQYSAHLGCQDMLVGCATRLRERWNSTTTTTNRLTIADLGSADGSNSVRTVEVFLDELLWNEGTIRSTSGESRETEESNGSADDVDSSNLLHIIFEEHPSSNNAGLTETVSSWLKTKNNNEGKKRITCDVVMKSFYEHLFEANSIDFCMSYICLYWLDSTDKRGAMEFGTGNACT